MSSVPAARLRRPPTWVRSGPVMPAATVPRMVWQPTQGLARNRSRPLVASPGAGSPAGDSCRRSQASYSSGVSILTQKRMCACWAPQNSEHSPRYQPGAVAVKPVKVVRPGIMSVLPANCGTQKLWITSADLRAMRTGVSRGRCISLAVTTVGPYSYLPPPLVADDGHRGLSARGLEPTHGREGEDEQHGHDDEGDDGPRDLEVAVALGARRLLLASPAEADDRGQQQHLDHEEDDRADDEQHERHVADGGGVVGRRAERGGRRGGEGRRGPQTTEEGERCSRRPDPADGSPERGLALVARQYAGSGPGAPSVRPAPARSSSGRPGPTPSPAAGR